MKVACRREERGSGVAVLEFYSGGSLRGIVVIDRRNGKKGGGMD